MYCEDSERIVYRCGNCHFTFGYQKNLNAHIRAKHGNKADVHECEECQSRFSNKRILVEHVKRKHGKNQSTYPCSVSEKDIDEAEVVAYF